jgi:hypothetical protein
MSKSQIMYRISGGHLRRGGVFVGMVADGM